MSNLEDSVKMALTSRERTITLGNLEYGGLTWTSLTIERLSSQNKSSRMLALILRYELQKGVPNMVYIQTTISGASEFTVVHVSSGSNGTLKYEGEPPEYIGFGAKVDLGPIVKLVYDTAKGM